MRYLFLLIACLLPLPVWAAPVVGASTTATTASDVPGTTLSANLTCTSDPNTVLVVVASVRETDSTAAAISTLTYGSLTLANFTTLIQTTEPATGTFSLAVDVRYAFPGASCNGTSRAVGVTMTNSLLWGFAAFIVTGVNLTTPFDTAVANRSSSAVAPITGSFTSEVGDLAMGMLTRRNTQTVSSVSPATDIYTFQAPSATGANSVRGLGSWKAGVAGTTTVDWDSGASAQAWLTVGVNVNAATVATPRRRQTPRYYMQLLPPPINVRMIGNSQ